MSDARWAGPADKADVERLFLQYWALQGEELDRIGFAQSWRESLRARTPFRFAVIGGKGVKVAAFATVHDTYSTHAGGPTIRVEDLFVDPKHAGQGYRQRLVAFAEEYGRRHGAKHMDVFLQAETSLDPDFLPDGFEPLRSPPFRKQLARTTKRVASRPSRKPSKTPKNSAAGAKERKAVPTGKQLTQLFR